MKASIGFKFSIEIPDKQVHIYTIDQEFIKNKLIDIREISANIINNASVN